MVSGEEMIEVMSFILERVFGNDEINVVLEIFNKIFMVVRIMNVEFLLKNF